MTIDAVSDARLIGYAGHNPLFDVYWYGPLRVAEPTDRTVGVYAIGCQTGRGMAGVRILPFLWRGHAVPLLFSQSFISGEAYSFLGMIAALLDGKPFTDVVSRANDEYQAFQRHHKNRAGRPFIAPVRLHYPKPGKR